MTTLFTPAELRSASTLLASPPLIRLITEIDDNGAIPPRRLAGILPDLSTHQLRRATTAAHAHHLVQAAPGAGLELTPAGEELADLYDATARLARHHAYPVPVCDFSSRIRHTLDLLPSLPATEHADAFPRPEAAGQHSADAAADLARLRTLLIQWLNDNPQAAALPEPETLA